MLWIISNYYCTVHSSETGIKGTLLNTMYHNIYIHHYATPYGQLETSVTEFELNQRASSVKWTLYIHSLHSYIRFHCIILYTCFHALY